MKSLFMAAAAAPLLVACATAAADTSNHAQEAVNEDQRVLVVNGEHIEIGEDENAGLVIIRAMQDAGDDAHVVLRMDDMEWSPEDREEFERAMAAMAQELEGMEFEFDFDELEFDGDGPHGFFVGEDGEHIIIDIENLEEWQAEHAERMAEFHERHGERMVELHEHLAENQERIHVRVERAHQMADRAREDGHRAHMIGLRAGAMGMEAGLVGINRALERGYVVEDGERRELTAEEVSDLEEARDDLSEELEEFREEHAEALALIESDERRIENVFIRRVGESEDLEVGQEYEWRFEESGETDGERQEIRVEVENGERRVWVNGEELEGEALESWLEDHEELDGGRVRIRVETDEEDEEG